MNLYAELGVDKSATEAVIRSAYRKKAKMAHPDVHGGSVARFNALKEARDVLLDVGRRAYYDATGKVKPEEIDQGRGAVLQLLGNILIQTVSEAVNKKIDLSTENLAGAIVVVIENQIAQIGKNRSEVEKRAAVFRDLAGRFEVDAGGDNVLRAICEAQIVAVQTELAMAEKNRLMHQEALKIAREHRFRREMKVAHDYQQIRNFSLFGAATGTSTW